VNQPRALITYRKLLARGTVWEEALDETVHESGQAQRPSTRSRSWNYEK